VKGGKGTVAAAFTRKGRVALVATTAPGHGNRRTHPGTRLGALRRAYPRALALGRALLRANARSPRLLGVRRGRLSYIAVSSSRIIARPRTLSSYLRLAGVSPLR
jgi:ribosomal protein S14